MIGVYLRGLEVMSDICDSCEGNYDKGVCALPAGRPGALPAHRSALGNGHAVNKPVCGYRCVPQYTAGERVHSHNARVSDALIQQHPAEGVSSRAGGRAGLKIGEEMQVKKQVFSIHPAERAFVDHYIVAGYRERLIYELAHKRDHACSRFAHGGKQLIRPERFHPVSLMTPEALCEKMIALGAEREHAHVLGANEGDGLWYDGPLLEVLRKAVLIGTILVIARNAAVVYYEEEPDYRSDKHLLY